MLSAASISPSEIVNGGAILKLLGQLKNQKLIRPFSRQVVTTLDTMSALCMSMAKKRPLCFRDAYY